MKILGLWDLLVEVGVALNILKHTKHHNRGIKAKMKRAGWDNSFLQALLCEI